MNWVDYWNGKPTIYVSDRHQEAHDIDIAFSVTRFIQKRDARVLDFGCGNATRAQLVANRCSHLLLWDAADAVRRRLSERYRMNDKITVLTPEALAELEPKSLDLITIISVIQYLDYDDLAQVLRQCRYLLADGGSLVIADVIPPNIAIVHDAWQLLRFGYQEGFLLSAALGMARTALSDYASVRSRLRLKKYSESEFVAHLSRHGFAVRRLDRNLGHNRHRMAFEARPADEVSVAGCVSATSPVA